MASSCWPASPQCDGRTLRSVDSWTAVMSMHECSNTCYGAKNTTSGHIQKVKKPNQNIKTNKEWICILCRVWYRSFHGARAALLPTDLLLPKIPTSTSLCLNLWLKIDLNKCNIYPSLNNVLKTTMPCCSFINPRYIFIKMNKLTDCWYWSFHRI